MVIPRNCRECEYHQTCTNPAPYGHYRCVYKKEIEKMAVNAILHNNKEVDKDE